MSIRRRFELVLLAVFVIVLVGSVWAYLALVQARFIELENARNQALIERVQVAYQTQIDGVEYDAENFSYWDETYRFIQAPSQQYLDAHVAADFLDFSELNLLLLIDDDNRVLHQRERSFEFVEDRIAALLLDPTWRDQIVGDGNLGKTGVLPTSDSYAVVSIQRVVRTNGEGPPRGYVIMAQTIDDSVLAYLASLVDVPVALVPWPDEVEQAPQIVSTDVHNRFTLPQPLMDGSAHLAIVFEQPREAYRQSLNTLYSFVALGALVLLSTLLALRFLFARYVLQDIEDLGRVMTADGEDVLPAPMGTARTDEIGVLIRAFDGMVHRVRDHQQKEAELQQHMRNSEAMRVLGQVTAGIAHVLNNKLMVVLGSVELAQGKEGIAQREHLQRAVEEIGDVASIIQQLRLYAQNQNFGLQQIELVEFARELVQDDRYSKNSSLRIVLEAENQVCYVETDPQWLAAIFTELIQNAADAMSGAGEICIGISQLQSANGEFAQVVFTDTGCGMEPASVERVFEPFFTSKPVGAGNGLGLSMVQGFVRQSGGDITLTSQPDAGTRVRLTLPLGNTLASNDAELTAP